MLDLPISILLFAITVGIGLAVLNSYVREWHRRCRRRFLVYLKDGGTLVVGDNLHRALKRSGVVEKTYIL